MAPSTFNQLFSGSHVSRPSINLGGSRGSSSEQQAGDLIERARREREAREDQRKRERAAVKLQAFVRGRRAASATRNQLRAQYDTALPSQKPIDAGSLVHATRLLVLLFVDGHAPDVKRLAAWCRAVLATSTIPGSKTPNLFAMYGSHGDTWAVLVRQCTLLLFHQATQHPSLSQAALFLEITKILCDPASAAKWHVGTFSGPTPLEYLLERNGFARLRALLVSIPIDQRNHPVLPAAVALALMPFKAFSAPAPAAKPSQATPPSSQHSASVHLFTLEILTIPLLPHRLPIPSVTALAAMPLESILLAPGSDSVYEQQLRKLPAEQAVHLLANLLAFCGKRVASFPTSKMLAGYLQLLSLLLDRLPSSMLVPPPRKENMVADVKGKMREVIIIDDSDDEDDEHAAELIQRAREKVGTTSAARDDDGNVQMGGESAAAVATRASKTAPATSELDPRTYAFLATLPSREHLSAVLSASTRYSSTTRPALASFLVSLIASWPTQREAIINIVMYSSGGSGAERGGGLLRELFRGYIRSSSLGRLLGTGSEKDKSGSAIVAALSDSRYVTDWPALVLLCELYSRCLLTLGDDEFYSTKGGNPLTLDEVVGLSGLLRNLAFALYWQETSLHLGASAGDGSSRSGVIGTRMNVEALRQLATTLLKQIHARDSRRSFTPEDHWLMTSQFDLASFIATVVYEDQKLEEEEDEEAAAASTAQRSMYDDEVPESRARRTRTQANLSKRQMAFISPRLGVLNNIPFVIPFETRVAVFRQFIDSDRQRLGIDRYRFDRRKRHRAVIHRTSIAQDAYAHLNGLGKALKGTVEIVFIDQFGEEEMGIDGGGLFKELLTNLSKEVFDTDRGLWLATKEQELYPNPHSYAREQTQLDWYRFIGRILGKALYEGILIDVRFADFFLSKWLGRQSYLDDLASLDPELYNGLIFLKNHTGNVEADLSLNFTVTDDDFGMSRTIDLVPGGSEIPVTNENRMQYIYLMANYRLNIQIEKQCSAFFAGLSEIIPERFLRLFNQTELRVLVGGADQPIDVEDLKQNTVYGGWDGDEANDTIRAFWRVVESFNSEDRSKLIRFVTSCARPPLLGFKELNPRFAIRNAGKEQSRLPTSSTCVNMLKLSEFSDEKTLREKLLTSINSGAGFDLS